MNLLRLGCLVLLLSLSAASNARIEGYYSQALDIDYALSGEDETIRDTLKRVINNFLKLLTLDEDEASMLLTPQDYFGKESEEDLSSSSKE